MKAFAQGFIEGDKVRDDEMRSLRSENERLKEKLDWAGRSGFRMMHPFFGPFGG